MYGTQKEYALVPGDEVEGAADTNDHPESKAFMSSVGKFAVGSIAVAAALLGSVAYIESSQSSTGAPAVALDVKTPHSTYAKVLKKLSPTEKALRIDDEYSRKFGRQISDGLLDSEKTFVAQLHKESTIKAQTSGPHIWKIDGVLQNDGNPTEDGITYTFTENRAHTIELLGENPETYTIYAKRVRREIRDLSKEDRDRYFNAMKTIYSIKNSDGQEKFGENYHSAWWYVAKHLEGAADKTCDHWHDDAGIVTHHIAVTWELENSLIAVDETTAAHYWDYTRDSSQADDSVDYTGTNIFNDEWFGPIESTNHPEHHVLSQGIFAYTEVVKQSDHTTAVTNPYGLLRSPWNTNPTPYVMRHSSVLGQSGDGYTTFPTCSDFKDYISSDWVGDMFYAINGPLHGSLHLMTGGHWGATEKMVHWIRNEVPSPDAFLLFSKFLWRQGYIRTPEMCASDTPATECIASCPSEIIRDRSAGEIFNISGITGISNPFFSSNRDEYGISEDDILHQLCSIGYPGELFTSAAPQDPLFWAIHGNAERFLSLARVLKAQGEVDFDETWGYAHSKIASDTGLICDWTDVEGMEMPKCDFGQTCPGHRADDLLPFTKLYDEQQTEFTNVEFYKMLNPANSAQIPYVYDSLLYWEGCTDEVLYGSPS